jgi:hypothetical protein
MALKDFFKTYIANHAEYDQLEAQIEALTAKRRALNLSWVDLVIKPLAKKLKRYVPGYRVEVLGPFGICNEVSIHFCKIGVPEEKLWDKKGAVKSISFVPNLEQGTFRVVDRSKDTKDHPEGSIGAVNGMNHPRIPIDLKWAVKDLVKFIR